ncbi:MAG: hypothetical protein WC768_00300 [Patescibacteria group bacterium]|jgi:hypothetical protein
MFLTVHAAAGVLIGQATDNVWLAFIFSLASHILIDIIPHGDTDLIKDSSNITKPEIERLKKIAALDGLVMLLILALLYFYGFIHPVWPVLAGISGGLLPDFLTGVYLLTKARWLEKIVAFHPHRLHLILDKFRVSFFAGIIIQIIFLAVLSALIIF